MSNVIYDPVLNLQNEDLNISLIYSDTQLTLENPNTQFLELFDSSNKFFGPLNITHFFRQKNSGYLEFQYLEYLGRSNKIVVPLDDFLSFSRTFVLTFWPNFLCVSGGKKCLFFGNFGMLCFLETPVLRFALLPYYRRI